MPEKDLQIKNQFDSSPSARTIKFSL